eukprot:NODE_1743_length_1315_cov_4.697472_g1452_i0.p2 GENE.NODE_1743_length_1315_cov_4.697472_g1452_i0~~NODE_1743_length_1315_cov_4.697472_g1452_i0.p2  ORF type:complete len:62 (-),score=5.52 NODE_1743_length_1315_cov_4.697472_g1452_i0:876-1061(-)
MPTGHGDQAQSVMADWAWSPTPAGRRLGQEAPAGDSGWEKPLASPTQSRLRTTLGRCPGAA